MPSECSSMKRILLLTICITLLVNLVYGQQANPADQIRPASWQRYTVKGEEFSITFPTHPAMTTYDRSEWPSGKARAERQLGAYADGVVYSVFSVDDGDPRQALKAAIEEIESSIRWTGSTQKDLTLGGFSGKQYLATIPPGGVVQLFATKNRFYRVQAYGANIEDPSVKQFFSSLSLNNRLEGIEVSDGQGTPFKSTAEIESSNSDTSERVFGGKDVDRKLILMMKPEPAYTLEAKAKQITGTVQMKVVFSSTGSVTNIRVVNGLPEGLTERAIDAARKIKFIPAVKDGKFVSMWIQLEYNFNVF